MEVCRLKRVQACSCPLLQLCSIERGLRQRQRAARGPRHSLRGVLMQPREPSRAVMQRGHKGLQAFCAAAPYKTVAEEDYLLCGRGRARVAEPHRVSQRLVLWLCQPPLSRAAGDGHSRADAASENPICYLLASKCEDCQAGGQVGLSGLTPQGMGSMPVM